MHNLNLYNSYDKSLADLNREYLENERNKPRKRSHVNWKKRFMMSVSFLTLSGVGFYVYLAVTNPNNKVTLEPPPPPDIRSEEEKMGYVQIQIFEFDDTAPVETINELVDNKEEASPSKDNTTEVAQNLEPNKNSNNNEVLIKKEDNTTDNTSLNTIASNKNIADAVNKQFQNIENKYDEKNKKLKEKIETANQKHKEKVTSENYNPVNPYEQNAIEKQRQIAAAEQAKKKDLDLTEPKKAPKVVKKAPPPPPPPPEKKYNISFTDLTEEQFKKVKSLTEQYGANIDFNRNTTTILIWEVYEKNDADPNKQKFLKEFLDKKDAYKFATTLKTPAVLKQIGKSFNAYNATVCCVNIENAKKLAKDTKITDKIIKIKLQK